MSSSNGSSSSKVTMADIARQSGVSPATVSLVLRNKPGVGAKTRQRVLDAAQALGYLFQASNQAEHRSTVDSIGLIVRVRDHDLATTNSFYAPVLAGIEQVCRRQQINLLYANLPVDEDNTPLEPPRLLTEKQTNGLLLVGMHLDSKSMAWIGQQKAPIVLVDSYAPDEPYEAVVTDNMAGAYEATSYLIQKGHQQIGIIGSQADSFPSIQERRAGYLKALADHDLSPHFIDCALLPDVAAAVASDFLRKNDQITALFACNDAVAIAVMQAAKEVGRQIPEELSVIGFDNIALAQHVTPALTTMRVDKMRMGRLAAHLLLDQIEFPKSATVRTMIRPHLIERKSVSQI